METGPDAKARAYIGDKGYDVMPTDNWHEMLVL